MSQIPFRHIMAAHCESGTVAALLNHHGMKISEPMVFGIASGIFFAYLKTPGMEFPMFAVRSMPGQVRTRFAARTGVKFRTKKYRNPEKAEKELNELIDKGQPVAVQVDFFYMNYFPAWYRIHVNVHFVTVIGREGDKYFISDSYHPRIAEIDRESFLKGRFAGGSMAPKGFMFYPVSIPENVDLQKAIKDGLTGATKNMLKIPLPFIGIKGIRRFADKITGWPRYAKSEDYLADKIFRITIFLEDQGTGGGGFRFLYASFLQEASKVLQNPRLEDMSREMMAIGDGWREVSLASAKIAKQRDFSKARLMEIGDLLRVRADMEESFFKRLDKELSNHK
ncbi:MAG: BtrH N-terminal domain-containing protein [Bacteroidales bacterium]|nr:BtrH N-terminal domain-containing protein [Bacteroidales bacterium]